MSRLSPARAAALSCLMEAAESGRYVREVLDASQAVAALDPRDAGLARRLALGVTATSGCLDELLDRCLTRPRRISPRVRMALRISTFELLYLGTPAQVAVSQGVELVRGVAAGASGLANAVLRRVASERDGYLLALEVPEGERARTAEARGAGLPRWLVDELHTSLSDQQLAGMLACELEPAPVALHENPLVADEPGGPAAPGGVGPQSAFAGALPGCVLSADAGSLVRSGALARAELAASDGHAQLIATASVRAGSCLEVGAGRGTKTFIMACQAARAGLARRHVALDLSGRRLRANAGRMERAGFGGIEFIEGDARDLDAALARLDAAEGSRMLFDTVLVDAPCSGTGTMRRHPEIPWRLAPADLHGDLPDLQRAILSQAAARVAPGGELFYATCSVLRCENGDVIDAFLSSEQGSCFEVVSVAAAAIFSGERFAAAAGEVLRLEDARRFFQSVPAPGSFDGHFCARLKRI